jgi:hypothetical protein
MVSVNLSRSVVRLSSGGEGTGMTATAEQTQTVPLRDVRALQNRLQWSARLEVTNRTIQGGGHGVPPLCSSGKGWRPESERSNGLAERGLKFTMATYRVWRVSRVLTAIGGGVRYGRLQLGVRSASRQCPAFRQLAHPAPSCHAAHVNEGGHSCPQEP